MKTLAALFFILIVGDCFAQESRRQLELSPFIRFDKYPTFWYSINPNDAYKLDIKGKSWGVNANYKSAFSKNWFYKVGLGYYKYSFSDLSSYNNRFNTNKEITNRIIDYHSDLFIFFSTDTYHYNCASINIGLDREFDLRKNVNFIAGLNLNNYVTFSQYYRIVAPPPAGPPDHKYKLKDVRYFGLSTNLNLAITKQIGRIKIGPNLLLPIYDQWGQDEVFPSTPHASESNSDHRNKWLGGFGVGFICNYSLTKPGK